MPISGSTDYPLPTSTDRAPLPPVDQSWRYLRWLAAIMVVGLGVSVSVYAEPFQLWAYPFSRAGRTRSESGLPNGAAVVAYTATMLLAAAATLATYAYYRREPALPFRRSRMALAAGAALGFVGGVAPSDVAQSAHIAGSAVMFGALWCLTCIQIELVRRSMPTRRGRLRAVLGWHQVLQAGVLPYAALYLTGHPSRDLAQKPAVFGLLVALALTSSSLRPTRADGALATSPQPPQRVLASPLADRIERGRD